MLNTEQIPYPEWFSLTFMAMMAVIELIDTIRVAAKQATNAPKVIAVEIGFASITTTRARSGRTCRIRVPAQ